MLRTFKTSVLTLAFIGYGGVAYLAAVHGAAIPAPAASDQSPAAKAIAAYNSGIKDLDDAKKMETNAVLLQVQGAARVRADEQINNAYKHALDDFKEAVTQDPSLYKAYNGLGFSYRKTGNYASALENYDRALKMQPDFVDALEYRAEAYLGLNRLEDAKQAYLSLLGKDRATADALMKAMTEWVAKHQADAAGVDPATVTSFQSWIKERAELAHETKMMALNPDRSDWKH
jgi:tetratricopeptide (TPR) repeat protein